MKEKVESCCYGDLEGSENSRLRTKSEEKRKVDKDYMIRGLNGLFDNIHIKTFTIFF